jgi:hypothetical protein
MEAVTIIFLLNIHPIPTGANGAVEASGSKGKPKLASISNGSSGIWGATREGEIYTLIDNGMVMFHFLGEILIALLTKCDRVTRVA